MPFLAVCVMCNIYVCAALHQCWYLECLKYMNKFSFRWPRVVFFLIIWIDSTVCCCCCRINVVVVVAAVVLDFCGYFIFSFLCFDLLLCVHASGEECFFFSFCVCCIVVWPLLVLFCDSLICSVIYLYFLGNVLNSCNRAPSLLLQNLCTNSITKNHLHDQIVLNIFFQFTCHLMK